MKKPLLIVLALACICLMPSCKKYASEIAFGDTAGMRVKTYDSTDLKYSYGENEKYYDIDLNKDGWADIKLTSRCVMSVFFGNPVFSYIKCENEDVALLGDIILQEHYIHSDTSVTQFGDITFQTITKTHTCERIDNTYVIEETEEKLSLRAANAGESFGLEDNFLSTDVALNDIDYGFCDDPQEISANYLSQVCNNYNNDCDYFPVNKEQYVGFKFNKNGRDHLGWIKIILEESQGDYYVRPIESAVQR